MKMMSEINCEDAILSAMAEFDGEKPLLSLEQTNAHLAVCENCRREIETQQKLAGLLQMQSFCSQPVDLWHSIEKRIESSQQTVRQTSWKIFVVIGVFLIAFKMLEMLPEQDFGFLFKLVPLIFAVIVFTLIKENPFKINTQLTLER